MPDTPEGSEYLEPNPLKQDHGKDLSKELEAIAEMGREHTAETSPFLEVPPDNARLHSTIGREAKPRQSDEAIAPFPPVEAFQMTPDRLAAMGQARLPDALGQRLAVPYALGVNQSGQKSVEEASAYLGEEKGVPLLNYNPDQRFVFFDERTTGIMPYHGEETLARGYFGPEQGRYVTAFPIAHSEGFEGESPATIAASPQNISEEAMPDDFFIERPGHPDDSTVNAKYIAGFIDADNVFHPNQAFMQANEFRITNKEQS